MRTLALIIGQTDYQFEGFDKLPSTALDVELMDSTLKRLNFETTVKTNKTNKQLKKEIKEFSEQLQPGDIVFFYYTGHGVQQTNQNEIDNYLLGIDAKIETDEGGKKFIQGVALHGKIFGEFFTQECIFLVVLDACRENTKSGVIIKAGLPPNSSNPDDLFPMTLSIDCLPEDIKQRQIDFVYACQPGYIALEPTQEGQVGYLAKALSTALNKPGTWSEALVEVIHQVQKDTNDEQKPAISINIGKQIYLKPKIDFREMKKILKEKSEPIITEENLCDTENFKFLVENGNVSDKLIEIQKDSNDIRVFPKTSEGDDKYFASIKGVRIVSDYRLTKCQYIIIELKKKTRIKIENCVFEGVGLKFQGSGDDKNYGAVKMDRVKIINAPNVGLQFLNVESPEVENIISQNCRNIGIQFDYITLLRLSNCYISRCKGGLKIFKTDNFYADKIDVYNCQRAAYDFGESNGLIRESGYGNCGEKIYNRGGNFIQSEKIQLIREDL